MLDGRQVAPNIRRDATTVAAMVRIYCEGLHGATRGELCASCTDLLEYAHARLARCPFGSEKTTCRDCPIHCYRADAREEMKTVMRYAGPRMLLRHPIAAIRHLWIERKEPPAWPMTKR